MSQTTPIAPTVTAPASRAKNALAAVAVVGLACGVYAVAPWNAKQMQEWHFAAGFAFSGRDFLLVAAALYCGLVAAWLLMEREPRPGKSLRALGLLARALRRPGATLAAGLDAGDRVALLATLLKAFFGPLMVMSLMSFFMAALKNGDGLVAALGLGLDARGLFNHHGFWLLLQAMLFVDVALFTVGYLVETPRLGNEIRSVDATWLGWAAALLCYPPFNSLSTTVLGSQLTEFPRFDNPTVHLVLNGLLLALMAVYTAASVALGWKASNLTHRGIVARGPYAFVRHPAYMCKNMAWWIGSVPLVSLAFQRDAGAGLMAVTSVLGWTMLYVLRALTEEDHLRRVDGEYAAYAERVRYRFVPGWI